MEVLHYAFTCAEEECSAEMVLELPPENGRWATLALFNAKVYCPAHVEHEGK
jgi:hypothetical protein